MRAENRLYIANAFSLSMLPPEQINSIRVSRLTDEEAKKRLRSMPWASAVGHEATARIISELTGVPVPVNRIQVTVQKGDSVLVFQLLQRLPEGRVLPAEEMRTLPHAWFLVEVIP